MKPKTKRNRMNQTSWGQEWYLVRSWTLRGCRA